MLDLRKGDAMTDRSPTLVVPDGHVCHPAPDGTEVICRICGRSFVEAPPPTLAEAREEYRRAVEGEGPGSIGDGDE